MNISQKHQNVLKKVYNHVTTVSFFFFLAFLGIQDFVGDIIIKGIDL